MKKNLRNSVMHVLMLILAAGMMLMGCADGEKHEHDSYTCPMHPTVISAKPGSCPVCGMDLVKTSRTGEDATLSAEVKGLSQPPNEVVFADVATVKPAYGTRDVIVNAEGMVTYDTRFISTLSSRIAGRLEHTMLK